MQIIHHRVNTLDALAAVPPGDGAEVDLRTRGGRLIVAHDPFVDGEDVESYLDAWSSGVERGTLILNPKEDGLDRAMQEHLAARGIADVAWLDLTVPSIVRLTRSNPPAPVAVRVSDVEPEAFAMGFAGRATWVWWDAFDGVPPPASQGARLAEHFRICLVSPELQGFDADRIDAFLPLRDTVHAVCTRHPDRWRSP